MKHPIACLVLLSVLALVAPAAAAEDGVAVDVRAGAADAIPKGLSEDDVGFFGKAASAGLTEVEAAKLAKAQAANPEVIQFAGTMVKDHTAAHDKLAALAKKKGVTLPTAPDEKHQKVLAKLKGYRQEHFDETYMDQMVEDHEQAVDLFEDRASETKDPEIKAFTEATLPTLKHHLDMAKRLRETTDERG